MKVYKDNYFNTTEPLPRIDFSLAERLTNPLPERYNKSIELVTLEENSNT